MCIYSSSAASEVWYAAVWCGVLIYVYTYSLSIYIYIYIYSGAPTSSFVPEPPKTLRPEIMSTVRPTGARSQKASGYGQSPN